MEGLYWRWHSSPRGLVAAHELCRNAWKASVSSGFTSGGSVCVTQQKTFGILVRSSLLLFEKQQTLHRGWWARSRLLRSRASIWVRFIRICPVHFIDLLGKKKTINILLIPLGWDVNMTTCMTVWTRVGYVNRIPFMCKCWRNKQKCLRNLLECREDCAQQTLFYFYWPVVLFFLFFYVNGLSFV